jgi:hypothetical protein
MRWIILLLTAITLSGCALLRGPQPIVMGGVDQMIDLNPGAKICGVSLPTDEAGKTYCLVIAEKSRVITMSAWNIREKYHR